MLILPRGAQKPGAGAQVNWDHPLAKGLLLCIPFSEGIWATTGVSLFRPRTIWGEVAPQAVGATSGTSVWTSNTEGLGIYCNNAYIGSWAPFLPGTGVTIAIIRRKLVASAPGGGGHLFGDLAGSGAIDVRLYAPYLDGNLYWDWGGDSAPNRLTVASIPLTTTIDKFVVTAGFNGMHVWRNGAKIGSSATAVTRTVAGSSSLFLNGPSGDNQEINFLWIVNYPWADWQCRWWSAEPYAALYDDPMKRTAMFIGGSAAPAVTGSPWMHYVQMRG